MVSYLPEKFAQKGRVLALKTEDGDWASGWRVEQVGPAVEDPPDWRAAIRQHRKATGDSLPKRALP